MGKVERWLCDQCKKLAEVEAEGGLPKGWDQVSIQFDNNDEGSAVVCGQGCAKNFTNDIIIRHFERGLGALEVAMKTGGSYATGLPGNMR